MRVISYVEGTLTVINGDNYYNEVTTKPSFITGTNFYYEPTLKQMDDMPLTEDQITDAEVFIDNFKFPTVTPPVENLVHCVDKDGNYIDYMVNDGTYQEVPSAPTKNTEKWNGAEWIDSVLIDKDTGEYRGIGDNRTTPNTKYAPNTIPTDFDISYYIWNGTAWNISLENAKNCKKAQIKKTQIDNFISVIGEVGFWEPASYITQEKEAREWNNDNTIDTPFIDALLTSRNLGETKQELVDKIIGHADAYITEYANLLGKYQSLVKQIQNATTVEEVIAINWS